MVHRVLFSTIDNSIKPFKEADLDEIAQHISKTERVAMKLGLFVVIVVSPPCRNYELAGSQ